uniref:Uncharacterized protein n=1 Tax=Anas platyrhynchos platyrhynchos TaxID=8840 RepID=A0A493TA81_ANAPP
MGLRKTPGLSTQSCTSPHLPSLARRCRANCDGMPGASWRAARRGRRAPRCAGLQLPLQFRGENAVAARDEVPHQHSSSSAPAPSQQGWDRPQSPGWPQEESTQQEPPVRPQSPAVSALAVFWGQPSEPKALCPQGAPPGPGRGCSSPGGVSPNPRPSQDAAIDPETQWKQGWRVFSEGLC